MSLLLTMTGGGGGTAWTVNVSDSISLSDAANKAAGKPLSDTITLSDGVAVIVPPLPPFPAVSLGGGMVLPYPQRHVRRHSDTRIPKGPKASKPRKELEEDEMEIIAVLTSWLASK